MSQRGKQSKETQQIVLQYKGVIFNVQKLHKQEKVSVIQTGIGGEMQLDTDRNTRGLPLLCSCHNCHG